MNLIIFTAIFGITVCAVLAYFVYNSEANFVLKLLALPYALIFFGLLIWAIVVRMGAPIESYPVGKFQYLAHSVTKSGKEIVLYAWMKELKDFRIWRFVYDRETAKKLQKARQERKRGQPSQGEFKIKGNGKRGLELYKGQLTLENREDLLKDNQRNQRP